MPPSSLDQHFDALKGSSPSLVKHLAEPERWHWITRWTSLPTHEVHHPKHLKWMQKHTHQHGIREVLVSLEGSHFYGVRGKIYRAEPVTIFLFDHSEPHDSWYSPFQPDCADLYLGILNKRIFARHVNVCKGEVKINRRLRDIEGPLAEQFIEAWDVCTETNSKTIEFARLRMTAILVVFQMLSNVIPPNAHLSENSLHEKIMTHITFYIDHHLEEKLSLQLLSRIAGYNPFYFHHLFQKYSGTTLHSYVNNKRLARAKELLSEGHKVQTVSEFLGFGSSAYFSRFFHDATGRPPTVWQRSGPSTSRST